MISFLIIATLAGVVVGGALAYWAFLVLHVRPQAAALAASRSAALELASTHIAPEVATQQIEQMIQRGAA